jgi:hypothetical protein
VGVWRDRCSPVQCQCAKVIDDEYYNTQADDIIHGWKAVSAIATSEEVRVLFNEQNNASHVSYWLEAEGIEDVVGALITFVLQACSYISVYQTHLGWQIEFQETIETLHTNPNVDTLLELFKAVFNDAYETHCMCGKRKCHICGGGYIEDNGPTIFGYMSATSLIILDILLGTRHGCEWEPFRERGKPPSIWWKPSIECYHFWSTPYNQRVTKTLMLVEQRNYNDDKSNLPYLPLEIWQKILGYFKVHEIGVQPRCPRCGDFVHEGWGCDWDWHRDTCA